MLAFLLDNTHGFVELSNTRFYSLILEGESRSRQLIIFLSTNFDFSFLPPCQAEDSVKFLDSPPFD